MRFSYWLIVIVFGVIITACSGKTAVFDENVSIENKTWKIGDTAHFDFTINDTNQFYDFYFNLRNTANYSYSNIFVFYTLTFPNNKTLNDTAEFILAKPNGEWLGKTISGSLIDNSMLFSKKRQFPLKGNYKFSVIHGMRSDDLDHVSNVGFKILESREH